MSQKINVEIMSAVEKFNSLDGDLLVAEGTTLGGFIAEHLGGDDRSSMMVAVNQCSVTDDYVLVEGDAITITPIKVKGA